MTDLEQFLIMLAKSKRDYKKSKFKGTSFIEFRVETDGVIVHFDEDESYSHISTT
jgi:hypothetical protein